MTDLPTAPFGATGHRSTRVIFGAAALGGMRQEKADAVYAGVAEPLTADDVADAVTHFAFEDQTSPYEVYNLTPTGEAVYAPDMAEAVGKKTVRISPVMVRTAFSVLWHLTRGRIPTCPGSWRFYSYPVLMSGEKLALVYHCKYSSKDAFRYTNGRYEGRVPVEFRNSK